jgi:hypothetical protein
VVFKDFDKINPGSYIEMEYLGEKVIVSPLTNNRYEIQRLISSSPQAYLNPEFQPGRIIQGGFS